MSAAKLVFSLTSLTTYPTPYGFETYGFFQVHEMDSRFFGCTWNSSSGWMIGSAGHPEIVVRERAIWLHGTDTDKNRRPHIFKFATTDEAEVATTWQSILSAIEEWGSSCPQVFGIGGVRPQSPEVRASLDALIDDSAEEGDEGPAPLFIDTFTPLNIRIR